MRASPSWQRALAEAEHRASARIGGVGVAGLGRQLEGAVVELLGLAEVGRGPARGGLGRPVDDDVVAAVAVEVAGHELVEVRDHPACVDDPGRQQVKPSAVGAVDVDPDLVAEIPDLGDVVAAVAVVVADDEFLLGPVRALAVERRNRPSDPMGFKPGRPTPPTISRLSTRWIRNEYPSLESRLTRPRTCGQRLRWARASLLVFVTLGHGPTYAEPPGAGRRHQAPAHPRVAGHGGLSAPKRGRRGALTLES